MKFKIEKNIPLPETRWHYTKFPFDKMEIGDSFFVTKEDLNCISKDQVKQKVYMAYKKYNIESENEIVLSIRLDRIKNGIRVYRTK